jgi:DNA polymerase-3 subunit delta'
MASAEKHNHQKQRQYLMQARENGRLAHAYVLSGPRGSGKLDFAKGMAVILQAHPVYGMFVYDTETGMTIEEARGLTGALRLKGVSAGYKVAVICRAERMSVSAANSLLKTLEEPASKTLIFLLTNNFYKLLPTIRSRVQRINFFEKDQKQSPEESRYFQVLTSGKELQRLQAAEELAAKDAPDIRNILVALMKSWAREGNSASIGSKLLQAYKNLESSVNTKLIMDNLFLP